jgi:hypothetical protein
VAAYPINIFCPLTRFSLSPQKYGHTDRRSGICKDTAPPHGDPLQQLSIDLVPFLLLILLDLNAVDGEKLEARPRSVPRQEKHLVWRLQSR